MEERSRLSTIPSSSDEAINSTDYDDAYNVEDGDDMNAKADEVQRRCSAVGLKFASWLGKANANSCWQCKFGAG
jgi:hypothetical protein